MNTKIYKGGNNRMWKLPILSVALFLSILFITNSVNAQLVITPTVTNVLCAGEESGSITISVTGGSGNYTFLWSNSVTTQNLTHVFAGTYTVTVSDIGSVSASSTSTITQPINLPQFAATIQNVSCFGQCDGMITVTPNGGTPGYTYHWQDGTTTQDLSNVCAGLYFLTVTDNNGCRAISNNFVAQPPTALVVVPTPNIAPCGSPSGGSISLSVSGGVGSYSFLWNTGATSQNLTNVPAGTYTVTVNDQWPCFKTTTSIIQASPSVSVNNSVTNVKCAGDQSGAIAITVTGGVAPFSYHWSNSVTTQNLGPVFAGTYSVTVTDINGCTGVTSGTVTQPLNLPQFAATIQNVSCFGQCNGMISVTPNGGTPGYTYHWQDGTTAQNLSNVCAGLYFLTVTDNNGCRAISNNFVAQPQSALTVIPAVTNISCTGGTGGSIFLTVSGGTLPYSFRWNTGYTGQNLVSVQAGTYTVTVTDGGPCTAISGGTVQGGTGASSCLILDPAYIPFNYMTGNHLLFDNSSVNPSLISSFSWTVTGAGWSITAGATTSNITYTAGTGTGHFTLTITLLSGCNAICTKDITSQISNEYCTVTQGYWGNAGGNFCNTGNKLNLINSLLGNTGLLVGCASNTMYFAPGEGQCIINLLPGGGPAARITGVNTCANHPGIQIKNGRIGNILLSQTITLGLNMRLKPNIQSLALDSPVLEYANSTGCMGGPGITNPVPPISSVTFPASVFQLMQTKYNTLTPTIANLYDLANQALGNCGNIPGNMLSPINDAVSLINQTFDGCKWGTFQGNQSSSMPAGNGDVPPQLIQNDPSGQIENNAHQIAMDIIPNPFKTSTTITFVIPVDSHVTLEIYNSMGAKINTLVDKNIEGGVTNTCTFTSNSAEAGIYICVLHTDYGNSSKRLIIVR
jgi:hypothetical protein